MGDRRQRPWKKLRAVVEVTVPPHSRADEKDLVYLIEQHLPKVIGLPRPIHDPPYRYDAATRVKTFSRFLPAFLLQQKRAKRDAR
jgi:hypothetical protein